MIKMNREQAITFLLHFTRVLQTDRTDLVTELLRDDETANAIAFILRHIANAVSEETPSRPGPRRDNAAASPSNHYPTAPAR
jgi:hypothetical protein